MKYDHTKPNMPPGPGTTDPITKAVPGSTPCVACGTPCVGAFSIHRDGFGVGPEVPLCRGCGAHELPTCETLWKWIAERLVGTTTTFAEAPCMRLLRHSSPVDPALRPEAKTDVWTRYIVRVPDDGSVRVQPGDRVACVWHGPSNAWEPIKASLAWTPWSRRLDPPRGKGTLTIVSLPLRGDETITELQAIASAAGGPIQ